MKRISYYVYVGNVFKRGYGNKRYAVRFAKEESGSSGGTYRVVNVRQKGRRVLAVCSRGVCRHSRRR